jgi:hypothetical protein
MFDILEKELKNENLVDVLRFQDLLTNKKREKLINKM